ncbi:Platinum sensitivity protein [Tulasnella sp. 424]|nr:Platinum sensitivity protein [Tulasnella sp. 424]
MLADFGLSKALEDGPTGLTTSGGLKGTLRYYSPELIRDEDSKHSLPSDIWAWGCLVLEALTDRLPYAEKKSEHSIIRALMNNEPPSDIESLSLPVTDLKNLLGRCWTIQPSERPSAIDCFQIIESALPTPRLMEGIDRTTALHVAVTAKSGRSDADESGRSDADGEVFSDEWLADMRRVKLYELIGSRWTDRGTGLCEGLWDDEVEHAHIVVRSGTSDVELLRSEIGLNDVYQRQQETLIWWREPDGTDYSLSFQDVNGCAEIWDFIIEVQRHLRVMFKFDAAVVEFQARTSHRI